MSIFRPRADAFFPSCIFLFKSQVGHSRPTSKPLSHPQKWTACIVRLQWCNFLGGHVIKKHKYTTHIHVRHWVKHFQFPFKQCHIPRRDERTLVTRNACHLIFSLQRRFYFSLQQWCYPPKVFRRMLSAWLRSTLAWSNTDPDWKPWKQKLLSL